MGKRVIQECDLTKLEYDPDETVKITITRNGKKGRTYELSADAANKLEQQLVGGPKLSADWSFGTTTFSREVESNKPRTLGDLEADDASFVADKRAELKEAGVISDEQRQEPEEEILAEPLGAPKSTNGCRHLNKGRIQTTLKGGKRSIYRLCNDCRTRVPEMTAEERKSFMAGKIADPDVRVREITQ